MTTLPTISLWQPWASLMAHGEKCIETRSWRCPLSLPCVLAIHASKRWALDQYEICDGDPGPDLQWLANEHSTIHFPDALQRMGMGLPGWRDSAKSRPIGMPFGAVVALCRLVECQQMTEEYIASSQLSYKEHAFGLYRPGRFAWITDAVIRLPEPIPLAGHQGIWRWSAPQSVLDLAATLCGPVPADAQLRLFDEKE